MRTKICLSLAAMMMAVFSSVVFTQSALAVDATQLDRAGQKALNRLYAKNPVAKELSKVAKGVLVFPSVTKVGFIFGGQYGEGVLFVEGKTAGYFNTVTASYGLQAGAQKFSYVLFFMDADSLSYLFRSEGWEIGVGPSVVFVDEGLAKNLSSTTIKEGIYAFIYGQQGLMAGLGIQGSKITRINP
jgi:lipid-binding SYLF domain-containing protein